MLTVLILLIDSKMLLWNCEQFIKITLMVRLMLS